MISTAFLYYRLHAAKDIIFEIARGRYYRDWTMLKIAAESTTSLFGYGILMQDTG